jgi:hypothetical protein
MCSASAQPTILRDDRSIDRGQIHPPLPGGDGGDVADIATFDLGPGPEGALDQVEGGLGGRGGDGGLSPPPLAPSLPGPLGA